MSPRHPFHINLDQKVKGQGHNSQNAKPFWRQSYGRCELCTLSSAQPL